MKKICLISLLLAVTCSAIAQSELENKQDSLVYALGMQFGNSLKQMGASEEDIDMDLLIQGMEAVFLGSEAPAIEVNLSRQLMQQFVRQVQEAKGKKALEKANAFLAENGKKEGVFTLESGMQYKVLVNGEPGASPTASNQVEVHYEGRLIDGTVFDSSYQRGEPITFGVTGVIKGWTEALQLMKPGDKWQLFIPANLAYGQRGAPPKIGPNELLIFDVELLGIK